MKKAILVLMILSMLLALAACGGGSGGAAAGTWQVYSVTSEGKTVTVDEAPQLRSQMGDLILKEDGTGSMIISGTKYLVQWDDKYISDEGEQLPYTLKGNTLELDVYGMIFTFNRK